MYLSDTVSLETISPQPSMTFKKDVEKAIAEIYDGLISEADETTIAKGNPISRVLVQKYNSVKARSQILLPIALAIRKHTNLQISKMYLEVSLEPNANVSNSPANFFLMFSDVGYSTATFDAVFRKDSTFNEELRWLSDIHYCAHQFDKKLNKFKSKITLEATMCIYSALFDAISVERERFIESLTAIILHELGHLMDGIDMSLRFSAASELGDDILDYEDKGVSVADALKMLQAVNNCVRNKDIRKDLIDRYDKAAQALSKVPEHTEGWIADVTALYTLCVREVEGWIGAGMFGKRKMITDSVMSSDVIKGNERRADKYSTRLYAEDGRIDEASLFLNAAVLAKSYNSSLEFAKYYAKWMYQTTRGNVTIYDTMATRALDSLKYKYTQISALAKSTNSKELKKYLERITWAEKLVRESLSAEAEFEKEYEFLDNLRKTAGRALFLFLSRNRLDQNSVLMEAARKVSRSSLHADAERIRLGLISD